jgi:hypothetical protein
MGLRQVGFAVVGADVPVDVEHPGLVRMAVEVAAGQRFAQDVGAGQVGELSEPAA